MNLPLQPPPELLERLQSSRRPLLIAHIAPDGDAIGSLLALGILLHRLGQDPVLACQDRVPPTLRFLPYVDRIIQDAEQNVDMVIALDSSDPDRMGSVYRAAWHDSLPLFVIDHHITNARFGDVNWIEPGACATAEMIYYLAAALGAPLQTDMATCILTGIVTDTRGFRTANTTPRVMSVVAKLMEAGAALSQITEETLNTRSFALVQLWARVLDTVELSERGVISALNTQAMREGLGALVRAEGLVSFILGVREARIAVLFTELPEGEIECSFRARPGHDVSALALEFGGGGHPLAAGCTISGSVDEVRRMILARLEALLSS
ncbi:MAG: bifunctional oligoribonuclease/PAP phosphatase NrnA [Chloroflexi bacterium]|nr:bifunctional oligoribonuclease/PAP phosphatase NrnA [Chloroflexota bacterium]